MLRTLWLLFLSLSFRCVATWRLSFLSESNWLTFSLVCAMQFWLNFSDCLMSLVCYSSSGISLLPVAAALCEQKAMQQCLWLFMSHFSSLCLPVCPFVCPSGASRTGEMRPVPKTAWVFLPRHTNPSSLTDSPLTGWSIRRWLMDTNTCWHSQKSCQPATKKIMIITAAWSSVFCELVSDI